MMGLEVGADAPLNDNKLSLEFRGNGKDYFGIWIVNLFLSIITLGIYTAWAKVRRQRYFYGNTFLDGHNFEYHAKPMQILIGRVIVVAILILYQVLVNFHLGFTLLLIPYLFAFPWILNKALSFNARVTSYRNVHFNFKGTYWRAMLAFIIMPIFGLISFGLLVPFVSRMSRNYIGNGVSWGNADFKTDMGLKPLYKVLGLSFIVLIASLLLFYGLYFGLADSYFTGDINSALINFAQDFSSFTGVSFKISIYVLVVLGYLLIYLPIILTFIMYSVGVRNVAYNATKLVTKADDEAHIEHQMSSNVSSFKYFWILVSNLIAVLFSVGLLRAWAAVRSWRYLAEHTAISPKGSLDNIVSKQIATGDAASAEFFDIEGIDFGL